MKVINHNNKEVLSSLLEFFETKGKSGKNQTIRKAYEEIPIRFDFTTLPDNEVTEVEKPCPYQVGDIVQHVFCQEEEEQYFCRKHGSPMILGMRKQGYNGREFSLQFASCIKNTCSFLSPSGFIDNHSGYFNKVLGKTKVTEIFKIRVHKESGEFALCFNDKPNIWHTEESREIKELATKDGFTGKDKVKKMFAFLEDYAEGLETPKTFRVTRWGEPI